MHCMQVWSRCRGGYLQEMPVVKVLPDILHNSSSGNKDAAYMVMVDNTVQIPLPIPCLLQSSDIAFRD